MMTHCSKVAQRKGCWLQGHTHEGLSVKQGWQKNQTRNKFARGTWKERTLRRRQLMHKKALMEPGTLRSRYGLETSEFDRKAFGLEFIKQATGMSGVLQKMRNWTLWRGWPF
jgi:hypothetical protein